MNLTLPTFLAVVIYVALLLLLATIYLGRIDLPRPPIGVYLWSDIAVMSVVLIIAPLGYLALPTAAVAGIFGLVLAVALQFTLAPMLGGRRATLCALALCAATLVGWLIHQQGLTAVLSDLVLTIAVIGVANLWVQGGMRASHVAGLAGLLSGYDLVATSLTSLMDRFVSHVDGLPFAPMVVLSTTRPPVEIGLGDLLMVVLFPLAATKAFGRRAGQVAAYVAVITMAVIALMIWAGLLPPYSPLLAVLGPLIVAQYVFWRKRGHRERTVGQWRSGTSSTIPPDQPSPLDAALLVELEEGRVTGAWFAIIDGAVVGEGTSPGLARRSAREAGHLDVPVVRQFWT